MKFNVIIKSDKSDSFAPKLPKEEQRIFIESIFSQGVCDHSKHNIQSIVQRLPHFPEENVVDFSNLSLAVYIIDQLVSRKDHGYQGWSRYFKVFIPVENITIWTSQITRIEAMLSFLTGDRWEVEFRLRKTRARQGSFNIGKVSHVSLFSGGLDSLIGAIDLLKNQNEIALISHHKGGGGGEKSTQELLIGKIQTEYPNKKINSNLFYVQPIKQQNTFLGEDTQRARSLMFIALGLLVANSYGPKTILLIPENALISLNVPLTRSRYGTYSTKTTHPSFIANISGLLSAVSIGNQLENPYKFKTKGEMITGCSNLKLLKEISYNSISCSKTNYYRRWTKKTKKKQLIASHCGHCVPCIIRRSAFYKAGNDTFKGNYYADAQAKVNAHYADIRAFKIGLHRFNKKSKLTIFDIFKGGIFPINNNSEISQYLQVYKRGMKEVEKFIYKQ